MTVDPLAHGSDQLDPERIRAWLVDVVDPAISAVTITKLDGGHSSGAWRIDVTGGDGPRAMVLKAPGLPSIVHRRDAAREGRILDQLGTLGAPVPAVLAIDAGSDVAGRPCFVMEHVDGRSVPDEALAGHHSDGWYRDAVPAEQRAIWHSFHDALAALHRADVAKVPDASFGPNGLADVLGYWRESLLDAAPAEAVPRQLGLLDWLGANLPAGADDSPSVCMGDARLVNALISGLDVRALVDFEVAYIGNPAADVGYSIFFDGLQRQHVEKPVAGIPPADDTWARWSEATGRTVDDPDYWTAFGATILCITATRAMIHWGLAGDDIEADNLIVPLWESAVDRAAR
jgi:aminoglycoside phosphotransferase (APT) family kinase protein